MVRVNFGEELYRRIRESKENLLRKKYYERGIFEEMGYENSIYSLFEPYVSGKFTKYELLKTLYLNQLKVSRDIHPEVGSECKVTISMVDMETVKVVIYMDTLFNKVNMKKHENINEFVSIIGDKEFPEFNDILRYKEYDEKRKDIK